MKTKISIALVLLLTSMAAVMTASSARGADGIQLPDGIPFHWINPAFYGRDTTYPLLSGNIIGYVENTNWTWTASYTNHESDQLNITAICTYFDWGKNYTYRFDTPLVIQPGMTQIFTVYNVTPSVTEAPEFWLHYYFIWIEHANNATTPYQVLSPILVTEGANFAVLSADHLTCLKILMKYGTTTPPSTNISSVQALFAQAQLEYAQAIQSFNVTRFGDARTHFENADDLINEALGTWKDTVDVNTAQAQATRTEADALMVNSYGWLLFGLGWVVIGIGIVIYGTKRQRTAPPPQG